jgi:hypothetical protein
MSTLARSQLGALPRKRIPSWIGAFPLRPIPTSAHSHLGAVPLRGSPSESFRAIRLGRSGCLRAARATPRASCTGTSTGWASAPRSSTYSPLTPEYSQHPRRFRPAAMGGCARPRRRRDNAPGGCNHAPPRLLCGGDGGGRAVDGRTGRVAPAQVGSDAGRAGGGGAVEGPGQVVPHRRTRNAYAGRLFHRDSLKANGLTPATCIRPGCIAPLRTAHRTQPDTRAVRNRRSARKGVRP